jgi:hypothetical protein
MSAGQIYAMSMCDYHVITYMSGFGRFAVFLSNNYHNAYQIDRTKARSCTQYDYDSLETLAKTASGV